MPFISMIGSVVGNRRKKPASTGIGGSLLFSGASTSNLSIANDADLRMGTGDFTIEWFQYLQTGSGANPRVFSIGTYASASIAVSIEGSDPSRTFYVWISGANSAESGKDYTNQWIHFAICRSGTTLRVFKNGTQIFSTTNSTNFNDSTNALRIGNETSTSTASSFKGYITNFRIVKGSAIYTANFTKPSAPLTAVPGTVLLLLTTDDASKSTDSSGLAKTVTNNSVTWSSLNPF